MALFTKADLAAYLQVAESDVADGTYLLLEQKVRTEIVNVTGQARFEATDETRFFSVALDMARRMYTNPSGLRSQQESIDDYSRVDTFASETVQPFAASGDEHRRIRRAAGMRGAFSIVIGEP